METNKSNEKSIFLRIGLIIIILGIVSFILSQKIDFRYTYSEPFTNGFSGETFQVRKEGYHDVIQNCLLYGGIAFFLIGGILAAIGLTKKS